MFWPGMTGRGPAVPFEEQEETTYYAFTGADEEVEVPAWATHMRAKLWGASGAAMGQWSVPSFGPPAADGYFSGVGGFSRVVVAVAPTDVVRVQVGEGGTGYTAGFGARAFPGGGGAGAYGSNDFSLEAIGGGGGGRSQVEHNSATIAIAGGGGASSCLALPGSVAMSIGGNGGGATGNPGGGAGALESDGKGGTQVAGGAGRVGGTGASLSGGDAVPYAAVGGRLPGGAGGDGYFGGGAAAGAVGFDVQGCGGGGGGGSGYFDPAAVDGETVTAALDAAGGGGLGQATVPRSDDADYVAFAASDYFAGAAVSAPRTVGGPPASTPPGNHGLIVITFRNYPF